MNKLRILFFTFLKIGAFTFGGGLAMLPLIHAEIVDRHKWMTDEDMMDMLIIAESTPGVIAVNAATYIGFKIAGVLGSIVATLGVILPSLIIILAIAFFFDRFLAIQWVQYAFYGIRAGVVVLIFKAVTKLYKKCPKEPIAYALMLLAFMLSIGLNLGTVWIILIGAVFGLVIQTLRGKEVNPND